MLKKIKEMMNYTKKKKKDLLSYCRKHKIKRFSNKNKSELISHIKKMNLGDNKSEPSVTQSRYPRFTREFLNKKSLSDKW